MMQTGPVSRRGSSEAQPGTSRKPNHNSRRTTPTEPPSRLVRVLRIVLALVAGGALLVVGLLGIAAIRTALLPTPPPPLGAPKALRYNQQLALEHFANGLRIKTISEPDQLPNVAALAQLRAQLEQDFPLVHKQMRREVVGAGALLYVWPGSDSALKPALLMGHLDVVPVDAATIGQWTHPPFDGVIANDFVWGRGTLDDKSTVFAILEAAEALLAEGFQPRRTMMFAFGDDEEVGGTDGAAQIVSLLKQRNTELEFVLDEGGSLLSGVVPGVSGDVALIGIAEKGYMSLRLRVNGSGGHSSMPPPETAIGILSHTLAKLEDHPLPMRLTPVAEQMFDAIAPQQPFLQRMALTNRWLFKPLLMQMLSATPSGAATVRTTTAETVINGGVKDNMLPMEASAIVNFRLLPGDNVDSVLNQVTALIDDPRVSIELDNPSHAQNPSPISSTNGEGFLTITQTIHAEFPDATVAPYLVIGGTDSAHYEPLTTEIFRFSPILLDARDLERMHGSDERLATDRYLHAVQFMSTLMRNAAG